MVSLVNSYTHKSKANEQGLINGLVKESIQMLGNTYYYLPREVQVENLVLGEDVISRFGLAIPIEMYLNNATGFQGDKEMFSKFGLEIRNSYKLSVHKERWEEEVASQFDGNQLRLTLETGIDKFALEDKSLLSLADLDNGEAAFTINQYIRPREGDLIYDPITRFLMEITFVDHDVEFFALGRNYQYTLTCEAFTYQNEIIETNVPAIDIFNINSTDDLANQVLLENGDALTFEQEGNTVQEAGNILPPVREYQTDFIAPAASKLNMVVDNPFA